MDFASVKLRPTETKLSSGIGIVPISGPYDSHFVEQLPILSEVDHLVIGGGTGKRSDDAVLSDVDRFGCTGGKKSDDTEVDRLGCKINADIAFMVLLCNPYVSLFDAVVAVSAACKALRRLSEQERFWRFQGRRIGFNVSTRKRFITAWISKKFPQDTALCSWCSIVGFRYQGFLPVDGSILVLGRKEKDSTLGMAWFCKKCANSQVACTRGWMSMGRGKHVCNIPFVLDEKCARQCIGGALPIHQGPCK